MGRGKQEKNNFACILDRDLKSFREKKIGEYVSIFNNDIDMVEQDYFVNLFQIYSNILGIILQVLVALYLNFYLTIIVIFIGLFVLAFPILFSSSIEIKRKTLLNSYEKMNGNLTDYFKGFEYIKISNLQNIILEKFNIVNEETEKKKYKYLLISNILNSSLKILSIGAIITILVCGAYFVIQNKITIGSLVAILQLYSGVFQNISELSFQISEFTTVKPVVNKLGEILADKGRWDKGEIEIKEFDKIIWEQVGYSYDGKTRILNSIDLKLERNKKYAIIGDSASGKSTIINLLLKKFSYSEGRIQFDDVELKEIKEEALYNMIGYVPQDIHLFCDTLQFNLLLKQSERVEEAKELIRKFELSKFVQNEQNMEDIMIDENSTNLSGGEKQRIGIIRELLKHKPILIMDEGTSNLNREMAEKIQDYILSQTDLTVIHVLHNYTKELLNKYDMIIRVEHGTIREIR
ncbi:ATP-binding cassette domain-containing protein [Velocimicrobium porci]|uniref:ABC transporter ATP-binding protein n=1 Tax=Velocimicrobium porci TaxID=2606634 RepID=A0A6L5XZG5_9FIRM|nr:ABC transporter ATP-binding protein [Velocimicrobium porci]MSS64240.1 ABC transporter ATP-binding protein [Velocimicrobium porci]